ncbi:hypothetical protein [Lysinibacillus pakistanensis]|uniref:Uncharacterized protein n=1 Tax=Lysinibacillus pakistanensis TaxID=759811 RepID=A0AAX3WUU8_9BACI|nr:hypothetical protein [Lysinibacillus pakistanensis]MDM5234582.1 hypothetical protein [Lysinibacillus pakistanensis]QGG52470.1 hypothetical protein GDS87_16690 [Lysinibacillus pakistanensis]WHY45158.1 hypothetical protein QNH22_17820 [Lysinibacillus pakistanensis]WHY50167.1 hypothetical protein QNH24_17785 [Lysinibacillus pakistanensis]
MNHKIIAYVEELESALMNQMEDHNEENLLFSIASNLIAQDRAQYKNVCQAYEVVKHHIVGIH